eukprot:TRINITY_DN15438_c0_g1_i1.p3 TRINITY_DN15438_c0_g1~~TRINITY_DN15438_c0_g1_i1.p3  ORF type:complete len:92 (+),score=15.79 TRINITY_DN15438_c0_g1_i1:299-574(+)
MSGPVGWGILIGAVVGFAAYGTYKYFKNRKACPEVDRICDDLTDNLDAMSSTLNDHRKAAQEEERTRENGHLDFVRRMIDRDPENFDVDTN